MIGFVLLLTMLMMAFDVPQRADRARLDGAQPGLGRRGVRRADPGLPARLGAGSLDFTSPGFVIDWLPLFVLVVLVGLSMDYHVFVLSRVREHVRTRAARRGSRSSTGSPTRPAW